MQGYDWDFGFGFGRRHAAHPRGYDTGFGGGGAYRRGGYGGAPGNRWGGAGAGRQGSQRGVYGEDYPVFGGVAGGRERGMYYGGAQRRQQSGYGRDYERGGGWGRPGAQYPYSVGGGAWGFPGARYDQPFASRGGRYDQQFAWGRGGYDSEYAREPFLPESAYRRHPELERQQTHRLNRWPGGGHPMASNAMPDDDEIEQAVRQSLHEDNWLDADRIEVKVSNGVVFLRGEVDDYLQARYAWDDAWESEGVRGVMNQLTVRVDQPSDRTDLPQTSSGTEGSGETQS